jgi:hypothetical protein
MTPLVTFFWGFAGSAAVEIVALLSFYYSESARLPRRYRRAGFWLTRVLLALLAGALAVGYDIDQAILAFNIGAATPLIITTLARGFRQPGSQAKPAGSGRAPAIPETPAPPARESASRYGRS